MDTKALAERMRNLLLQSNKVQFVTEAQRDEILKEQEMLRAKVNQMSSLERIRKRAEEELGLQNPSTAPKWLRVDSEKAREVEEALPKR